MVSTTAVSVQAKTLFYILVDSLPEKEIMESANYFEVEPSTKKKAWEGARGTVFPAHFRFALSTASKPPAYGQSSTKSFELSRKSENMQSEQSS